jgi:hypothetical protein
MTRFTSIAGTIFTAAFLTAATNASAQDSNINQRTYLTFSGPVQMPGITLPAGKYVFRLADTSLRNVMQVFDADEKKIFGQWFFIAKNRTTEEANAANRNPVVMFREMPEKMTPAIQYYFYPTDLTGKEFIYPKDQALKIAAATHQTVLATDTDVKGGGQAHVFRVEPDGTASSTASLNSQADVNNSPASGPPPYSAARSASANDRQATGASGQNPAPRQQAAAELPKTASPLFLIALIGLLSLAAGVGLRLARSTY